MEIEEESLDYARCRHKLLQHHLTDPEERYRVIEGESTIVHWTCHTERGASPTMHDNDCSICGGRIVCLPREEFLK